MAIAVMPEPPRDRWQKLADALLAIAAVAVLVLFIVSMLLEYVF